MCLLSNNVNDYHFVSQGKTSIPGVDDGEEFKITDVSLLLSRLLFLLSVVYAHVRTSLFTRIPITRHSDDNVLNVFLFFFFCNKTNFSLTNVKINYMSIPNEHIHF